MSEFWKRKMRTFFKTWDFNGDGYISKNDFADMGRHFADTYNANDERKEDLIQTFVNVWTKYMKTGDVEKEVRLTLPVFIESVNQLLYDPELITEIDRMCRIIFELMDINKDGYIQPDEYEILLKNLGVPEGTFDAKSAFKEIDVSGDGKISIDEFIKGGFDFMFSQDESSPNAFFFGPLVD